MQPIHLFDSYYFRDASAEDISTFYNKNSGKVFADTFEINVDKWLTDQEKQKRLTNVIKSRFSLRAFILKENEIIGWHIGWQLDEECYFMCDTGIFKEHQGKGIYTALLPKLLEIFKEKGFQKVVSKHHAANNNIIIPKLKAGFVITGFEIDERFGLFVTMAYIFNEKRLEAYQFRTGFLRPDEDMRKCL